MMMMMIG